MIQVLETPKEKEILGLTKEIAKLRKEIGSNSLGIVDLDKQIDNLYDKRSKLYADNNRMQKKIDIINQKFEVYWFDKTNKGDKKNDNRRTP